jgi:hypothetical protein
MVKLYMNNKFPMIYAKIVLNIIDLEKLNMSLIMKIFFLYFLTDIITNVHLKFVDNQFDFYTLLN